MTQYDVFNGDADGICALHQLRLERPVTSVLVTGPKRDIQLLERVDAGAGDRVTVLDISLDKNREALVRLLARGVSVTYFDHHFSGEIPDHPGLEARIDTSPETCTSLLVDAHLDGRRRIWAVVGAFGDNFHEQARRAARPLGLDEARLQALEALGTCLNYNGYGVTPEDLFYPPDALYRSLQPYEDPFAFMAGETVFGRLEEGYRGDMAKAQALRPEIAAEGHALYVLPDEPWTRRVSGVFGNELARHHPGRAHALLTALPEGGFRISVRAPLEARQGADTLCRAFPGGGGRPAAAGINQLEADRYAEFVEEFRRAFP